MNSLELYRRRREQVKQKDKEIQEMREEISNLKDLVYSLINKEGDMTVTIANTNLVDSFNTWRPNTNLAATTISNNVVTVTKTGAARGHTR